MHILLEHHYQALDLLKKLQSGSDFSLLAKKFSKCSSAQYGGDLGLVDLTRLDEDFADAAEKLQENAVSDVVRTRFGYHLIKRLG